MIRRYEIMLKNSGELILCDKDHWEIAKHCTWYQVTIDKQVRVVNGQKTFYEDYVGITGQRKTIGMNFDLRSIHYG